MADLGRPAAHRSASSARGSSARTSEWLDTAAPAVREQILLERLLDRERGSRPINEGWLEAFKALRG